jgi:Fe-S-cluster-containing hydrogenase component 2
MSDTNRCTGCGKCADICFLGGISMTGYREAAVKRFESFLAEGRLKPQDPNIKPMEEIPRVSDIHTIS